MHHILGLNQCREFWQGQDLKRPRFQACKGFFKNIKKEEPIPFTLHGDGAPHTEVDTLQVLSMRSILTQAPIAESQLLLFSCPKACLARETMEDVMALLAWSFTSLTQGKFPDKDPWGSELDARRKAMAGLPIMENDAGRRAIVLWMQLKKMAGQPNIGRKQWLDSQKLPENHDGHMDSGVWDHWGP